MPNPRTVKFEWAGREYQLPVLLARDAIAFFEKEKELQKAHADGNSEAQFRLCLDIMDLFGLPAEVKDDLAIDEIQACMFALMAAKMPGTAESSGRPFDATETTTGKLPGSSSPTTPDSSVAG